MEMYNHVLSVHSERILGTIVQDGGSGVSMRSPELDVNGIIALIGNG
jgi:hypothetical protein